MKMIERRVKGEVVFEPQVEMIGLRILYYTDHHPFPLPLGHRFPISKYRLTRELLRVMACMNYPSTACRPGGAGIGA